MSKKVFIRCAKSESQGFRSERTCKTGPQSKNAIEHFDEFTSPDSVSLHKRVQGAGLGSFFCHLRSKRRFSSFAVTKRVRPFPTQSF
jgi:hypothetical protein